MTQKKKDNQNVRRGVVQSFGLCLVHVKYFLEMLFSGKENIFKCLVAFQKMLWKIFSNVWLFC